ncbi:MAG: DUF2974 domain-containing protein [Pseudobutyrivibrio sp.]|nr:DUF2974 domain-containing protein [Pseudobutyrivibrio sp.]
MGSMKDYLEWRGDISFKDIGPNAVDSLMFATLCYIHLNNIMPSDFCKKLKITEVNKAYKALPKEEQGIVRRKTDIELLDAMASFRRFKNTILFGHVEEINLEDETQFAAITYLLEDGTVHVTFRGTDNTVPGWKEDFNMSFMEEVPGQGKAVKYLEKIAAVTEGQIIISGHSKGGNFSQYCAIKCSKLVQDRIKAVYSFDGPGFMTDILDSEEYHRIEKRVHSYIPDSSMVGMFMNHIEKNGIVKSNNPSSGFLQHDPYSWEILGGDFIYAPKLASSSHLTDTSIKAILSELTPEERKLLSDHLFNSFNGGDVKYVADVFKPANIVASIKGMQEIPKERQQIVKDAQKKLMNVLYENFKENFKSSQEK